MDPVRNPYMPGAGRKPAALVGRDDALQAWGVSLQRSEHGLVDQPFVLYGLRGVGKTVLLTQFRHDAAARGWWVVQVEAGTNQSLRQMVGEGLYEPLAAISRPSAGQRLLGALKTALSFKASYDSTGTWSFGLDLSKIPGGDANSGVLDTDLKRIVKDVALAAGEEHVGLALLIDEAQDLTNEELTTLAVVAQAAAEDTWPVLFALAGLPSLPQVLAQAKSYTERFQHIPIEKLSWEDARAALELPAVQEQVSWDPDALTFVVEQSGRYPYFIQQFGQEAWKEAHGTKIELEDARVGVAVGQHRLDAGFFRSRWDRTTTAEKRYLQAMCSNDDSSVGSGEVAARLGKSIGSLGPTRASLIHKGLIYAPDHGVVAFTVPGMSAFISRQLD